MYSYKVIRFRCDFDVVAETDARKDERIPLLQRWSLFRSDDDHNKTFALKEVARQGMTQHLR